MHVILVKPFLIFGILAICYQCLMFLKSTSLLLPWTFKGSPQNVKLNTLRMWHSGGSGQSVHVLKGHLVPNILTITRLIAFLYCNIMSKTQNSTSRKCHYWYCRVYSMHYHDKILSFQIIGAIVQLILVTVNWKLSGNSQIYTVTMTTLLIMEEEVPAITL